MAGLPVLTGPALAQSEKRVLPPEGAPVSPGGFDPAFNFWLIVSIFFFTLITVLVVVFILRYVKKKGEKAEGTAHHNTTLEIVWTVIPTLLTVFMFYLGFTSYMDLVRPPQNAYEIQVLGQKWNWLFTYPNGHTDEKLHVPAGKDIKLIITSIDVLHSAYIPAFRIKQDAVRGRYTYVWFNAPTPGEYYFFCAEYCGTGHSDMITTCVVHTREDFEYWLDHADPLKRLTPEQYEAYRKDPDKFTRDNPDFSDLEIPAVVGKNLYGKFGCTQCHTTDGTRLIGPTFKDLWGTKRQFEKGPDRIADENYIRESIVEPQKEIVKSYEGVMPTFKGRLKDREIYCLIEFIKTFKKKTDKKK